MILLLSMVIVRLHVLQNDDNKTQTRNDGGGLLLIGAAIPVESPIPYLNARWLTDWLAGCGVRFVLSGASPLFSVTGRLLRRASQSSLDPVAPELVPILGRSLCLGTSVHSTRYLLAVVLARNAYSNAFG